MKHRVLIHNYYTFQYIGYLLFDHIIMSAIDTYRKYNLHSAVPYMGDVRVCKKQARKCSKEGNVRGEMSEGKCPTPSLQHRRHRAVRHRRMNYAWKMLA